MSLKTPAHRSWVSHPSIGYIKCSPGSSLFLTIPTAKDFDNLLNCWDTNLCKLTREVSLDRQSPDRLAIDTSGRFATISGGIGSSGKLITFRLPGLTKMATFKEYFNDLVDGEKPSPGEFAILAGSLANLDRASTPDRRMTLVRRRSPERLECWNGPVTQKLTDDLPLPIGTDAWTTLAIDGAGLHAAVTANDCVYLYKLASPDCQSKIAIRQDPILDFAVAADNRHFACVTKGTTGNTFEITIWSNNPQAQPVLHRTISCEDPTRGEKPPRAIAVSPDGQFVVMAFDEQTATWRLDRELTPKPIIRQLPKIESLTFADKSHLVVVAGHSTQVWDLLNNKICASWDDLVTSIAFGRTKCNRLAVGRDSLVQANGRGGLQVLKNLPNQLSVGNTTVMPTPVLAMAMEPSNQQLFVTTEAGEFRFYDAHTLTAQTIKVSNPLHVATRNAVFVNPNLLVTASDDNKFRFWRVQGTEFSLLFSLRTGGKVERLEAIRGRKQLLYLVKDEHNLSMLDWSSSGRSSVRWASSQR